MTNLSQQSRLHIFTHRSLVLYGGSDRYPAKGEDVFNICRCSKRGGEATCATRCCYFTAPNPQQATAVSAFLALKTDAVRAVKNQTSAKIRCRNEKTGYDCLLCIQTWYPGFCVC